MVDEAVETNLPRETGEEKSTVKCTNCGSELPAVKSEYGSLVPGACTSCWPAGEEGEKPESQLDAQNAAADKAPAPEGTPAAAVPVETASE